MATSVPTPTDTWNDIYTTTMRIWRTQMYDQVFRSLPLFAWLESAGQKKTQAGGTHIVIPLMYGINTGTKAFEKYDLLPVTPPEIYTAAQYNWKSFATPVAISGEEERKNMGKAARFNMLQGIIKNAQLSARWWLNDLLHGLHGSHGKTFVGGESSNTLDSHGGTAIDSTGDDKWKNMNSLDHIVRSGWGMIDNVDGATTARSHIVGGITVSTKLATDETGYGNWDAIVTSGGTFTNPWWMNYSLPGLRRLQRGAGGGTVGNVQSIGILDSAADIDGNSGQNVVTAMRYMYNLLSDGTEHPDFGLCGQDVFEAYEASQVSLIRYTNTRVADAGFTNLKFHNMTLIFDHGITTALRGTPTSGATPMAPMYLLNSGSLEWVVHPEADFTISPFVRPSDQDARVAQILTMGNLCCNNRSKNGVIMFGDGADYTA